MASCQLQIFSCSIGALRQGVKPGMPLAEARALGRAVRFEPYQPRQDREALRRLALYCQRFTPLAAVEEADAPESLLLDITGCDHLFGGEAALLRRVACDFRRLGHVARLAIANTIGAAWAVAHYAPPPLAIGNSQLTIRSGRRTDGDEPTLESAQLPIAHLLAPLPVEALRLPSEVVQALGAFDLRRIGQLLALPRSTLPSRFGPELLRRLDQALGEVPELLNLERPSEPIEARESFEFSLCERRIIGRVLEHLLDRVLEQLRGRRLAAQRLEGTLELAGRQPVHFVVGLLQASDSAPHLVELLRLHFERLAVPGEVSAVRLRVLAAAPVEVRQELLFDSDREAERHRQFSLLIERLSGRLGEEAVLRPALWPDFQPEFAWRYASWLGGRWRPTDRRQQPAPGSARRVRPLCLKRRPSAIAVVSVIPGGPPVRFDWQGRSHVVAQHWGPERIETGWWRGPDIRRDYYLVETATGERFWLFRQIEDGSWFLHGTFA